MKFREDIILCDKLEGFVKEVNGETFFDLGDLEGVQQEVARLRGALSKIYPKVDFKKQLEIRATMRHGVGYIEIMGNRSQMGIPGIEPLTMHQFFKLVEELNQDEGNQAGAGSVKGSNRLKGSENQILLGETADESAGVEEDAVSADSIDGEVLTIASDNPGEGDPNESLPEADGSEDHSQEAVNVSVEAQSKPTQENEFDWVYDFVVLVHSVDEQAYTVHTKAAPEMKSQRAPKFKVKDQDDFYVFLAAMLLGEKLKVSFKIPKKGGDQKKFLGYSMLTYCDEIFDLGEAFMVLRAVSELEKSKRAEAICSIARAIQEDLDRFLD